MTSAEKSRAISLWLATQPPSAKADFMFRSVDVKDPWTLLTPEQRKTALALYKNAQATQQKARMSQAKAAPITMTTPDRIIHIKGDTYTIIPQAPVVNVTLPTQPAPIINVTPQAAIVNVEQPDVIVNVPEQKAGLVQDIRIIDMPDRRLSQVVVRDGQGRIVGTESATD